MDEGVVERGVDVSDTENELALSDLRTEGSGLLGHDLLLLGGLHPESRQPIHPVPHTKDHLRPRHSDKRV